MNSVSWFGRFPHRLSAGLSVGLLRAAAGLGSPARAFLNLEIRGLSPPGSVRPYPKHRPESPPPFGGGRAVVGNALQPFPRAYRKTQFPARKAASLKADDQPRAFPQAPGRLPAANSPPADAITPNPRPPPNPPHRMNPPRNPRSEPAKCRMMLYEAQIRKVPYIYIYLYSFIFF